MMCLKPAGGGHALDDKEFTVAVSFGAGGYEHGGYSHYTPHEILRPFQQRLIELE